MVVDTLTLGIQTTPNNVLSRAISNARYWAPKRSRSFTICLSHTDYHGHAADQPTGYARSVVRYFSTKKEGLTIK